MSEVNDVSQGAEIIDFEEILMATVASARALESRDEEMSALLIQHLNILARQMETEATLCKEIALEEQGSDKISQLFPAN